MFDTLSERLQAALADVRSRGALPEVAWLYANVSYATGGRIKTNMGQRTIFAIRTKYSTAKLKLLHFRD